MPAAETFMMPLYVSFHMGPLSRPGILGCSLSSNRKYPKSRVRGVIQKENRGMQVLRLERGEESTTLLLPQYLK